MSHLEGAWRRGVRASLLVALAVMMSGCSLSNGLGLRPDTTSGEEAIAAASPRQDHSRDHEGLERNDVEADDAAAASSRQVPRAATRVSSIDAIQLIGRALSLEGVRYRRGGSDPAVGFDCSGFVGYLYREVGVALPRSSAAIHQQLPVVANTDLRPGDLLTFRIAGKRISHVGMFIGGDRFIHATSTKTGRVMVSALSEPYWKLRLAGARRPPEQRILSQN